MTQGPEQDRANRAALENAVQEARAQAAAEHAKREMAEQAARDASARAAAETTRRESAEQAAHEAQIQSAANLAARDAAARAAQESASEAAAERSARQSAEKALQEAAIVIAERAAREAAEASFRQTIVKPAGGMPSPAVPASAPSSSAPVPPPATPAPQPSVPAPPPKSLASAPQSAPAAPAQSNLNWLIPLAIFAGAGLLFFVITSAWTTWQNTVSVKTDDAYIKADVAPLSTKAIGIVKSAPVDDFQSVKAGQILVELKNDEYQARVDQAAQLVRQAEIRIADMKQRKEQQDDRVAQARTALDDSGKSVSLTDDAITSAQASLQEAKAGIEAARAAITQSKAATEAAAADVTRSSLERTRQQALLAVESTTKQRVEQTIADNERTMANVEAAKGAESRAKADLAGKQALLSKANQALASSRVDKAKSLLLVANHQSELSAQIKQRELLDGEEKQLISDLAGKKAALTAAKVDLDYTTIRAPADGIVGELKVKPGQLVGVGTQVITMISAKPWVIANYRETQLSNVREGDSADIAVDAVSGTLKGHVERIAPASGAEFSLLPPENASGNFTKIIQRIPVKISFDEDQQRLANLRPGMSAVVTIAPGSRK